jgi:hypothetical protein
MYHVGQTSAQLKIHAPLPCHAGIINSVIATAKTMAEPSLIRTVRKPHRTPQIAGTRNRSKQSLEREDSLNLARQNKQGEMHASTLTHTVRRDTDPTTKPPVHAHPINSSALQISIQ